MQKTDGRVELGMVNLVQTSGIAHHVPKGNQSVDFVFWRAFVSSVHAEIVEDFIKSIVIRMADISFYAHQSGNVLRNVDQLGILIDIFEENGQLFPPILIIFQVFANIERSAFNELFGDNLPFRNGKIVPGLFDLHFSGQ